MPELRFIALRMKTLDNTIRLSGLRFYAFHGVEPQERIVGAWYSVDLTLKTDCPDAVASDSLSATVNYAEIAELVRKEMSVPSNLLEHVAGRIVNSVMKNFDMVEWLQVSITKQTPPVCSLCSEATFTLTVGR